MKRNIIILWAITAVALFVVGGIYWNKSQSPTYCKGEMNMASGKLLTGPFSAINQDGIAITDKDVIKGPTLLYFGYSFCPDVCPLDTARNARVAMMLKANNINLTPVFITVDPARDTPQVMKEFVRNLSDDMIGLTGSAEEINTLKKIYGAYGQKSAGETDPEFYMVDHTAFTYLVTPNGFVAAYDRDKTEAEISENIQCHQKSGDL